MTRQWMLLLCVAAAAVLVSGCNRQGHAVDTSGGVTRQVSVAPGLVAQARPPIPDVPVPVGFRLDQRKSRNFAAAGTRYVDHRYRGGDDKYAVARFYKSHMPISRWALVTDMFVQGNILLDFEKETERCRITIDDGCLFHASHLTIQLWTTGRIPTRAPVGKSGK